MNKDYKAMRFVPNLRLIQRVCFIPEGWTTAWVGQKTPSDDARDCCAHCNYHEVCGESIQTSHTSLKTERSQHPRANTSTSCPSIFMKKTTIGGGFTPQILQVAERYERKMICSARWRAHSKLLEKTTGAGAINKRLRISTRYRLLIWSSDH